MRDALRQADGSPLTAAIIRSLQGVALDVATNDFALDKIPAGTVNDAPATYDLVGTKNLGRTNNMTASGATQTSRPFGVIDAYRT